MADAGQVRTERRYVFVLMAAAALLLAPQVQDARAEALKAGMLIDSLGNGISVDGRRTSYEAFGAYPTFSVDGQKVAGTFNGSLRVVTVDGSHVFSTPIATPTRHVAWSPDGTMVAFFSPDGLAVVNEDGTGLAVLDPSKSWATENSGSAPNAFVTPEWSPDGGTIVWPCSNSSLCTIGIDGTGMSTLVQNFHLVGSSLDWSPSGLIAYTCGASDICTVELGGAPTNLGLPFGWAVSPAWSPDGSQLAFVAGSDVYVSPPDGTPPSLVHHGYGEPGTPVWSPDGTRLAFLDDVVVTAAPDGSNEEYFTVGSKGILTDWQPCPTGTCGGDPALVQPAPPPPCNPGTWRIFDAPIPATQTELLDVFAFGPSDAWAVGRAGNGGSSLYPPLVLHFDGASWKKVGTPSLPSAWQGTLRAVEGSSPNDVWAVGYTQDGAGDHGPLIQHWNGEAWSLVPGPSGAYLLYDVVVHGTADAWAVGYSEVPDPDDPNRLVQRPATLHWDGVSWNAVPAAGGVEAGYGYWAVSAATPDDMWALGQWWQNKTNWGASITRWDGESWTLVPSTFQFYLADVAAVTREEAWFVGYQQDLTPRIERLRGTSWETVEVGATGMLIDVAASSARDIWILGTNSDGTASFGEHWDGSALAVFPTAGASVSLEAMSVDRQGGVWAVGSWDDRAIGITRPYVQQLCPIVVADTGVVARLAKRTGGTTTKADLGAGVAWKFKRSSQELHRVRETSLGLFDSGLRRPGGSFTSRFFYAGSYPWVDRASSARGLVHVRTTALRVADKSVDVRWARRVPPKGFVFDVQVRKPGSEEYRTWLVGVRVTEGRFVAPRTGVFDFRSRLRRMKDGAHSGWSPRNSFTAR